MAELSGRTVTYAYDDLYRLTSETVAGATAGNNGQVTYSYDSVGNRKQIGSTLAAVPSTGLLNYDANDRTSTDSYDPNGNLLLTGAGANTYDFENRLVAAGGVRIVYDGDGNRVLETVAGVTTKYLVADINPTGYPQVIDERRLVGPGVDRAYVWGLQLIAVRDLVNPTPIDHYYGTDGHGSVRFLTDSNGAITDTYDYDAFGNLISRTGTTTNNYLFAGEQFDPALGVYYNRARYYDQRVGRFWTMDTFEGISGDPLSLHKYTYANNNPVRLIDPSGNQASVEEEEEVLAVQMTNTSQAILQPAVAGGAQAAAQTVVVTSQLQVALSNLLTTSLIAGPLVAAVLPTDAPKREDDKKPPKDNRGRLQVQGGDIEGQKYDLSAHTGFNYKDDTLSWPWSQPAPLPASTALSKLSEFLQILTYDQIGRRGKAFADASRFIQNASVGGGTGPTKVSFNARDRKYPDARVDIEVQTGLAFTPF